MNDRMEQEIRRTILRLQASMPEPRDRQTPVFTLLRIAAGEINGGLLLGLFAGALIFGLLSVRALSMPMLTIFCTAPMPMLLLFHRYVLASNQNMRELEATFPYSYPEMLAARSVVISCCMFGALVLLSVMLHVSASEAFFAAGALRRGTEHLSLRAAPVFVCFAPQFGRAVPACTRLLGGALLPRDGTAV